MIQNSGVSIALGLTIFQLEESGTTREFGETFRLRVF